MNGFTRTDRFFSLCGLNCGLCTMRLGGHCAGCGLGSQPCKIARCSLEHGGVAYCFLCPEYPCPRYRQPEPYDCFITQQNRLADMEKARRIGAAAYGAEQQEKMALLARLLENYNDGRRKTLYAVAVNLLEAQEVASLLAEAEGDPAFCALPLREQAAQLAAGLQNLAARKNLLLKLRRKPPKG